MIDIDKAIDGLEICINRVPGEYSCIKCPYEGYGNDCEIQLSKDILSLLKEQKAMQWINAKDKLPEKDGEYLVVHTFFNYRSMRIARFSHNLHEIDEYIFDTENRPGWYEFDDEVGYFEWPTVTHWTKLPEFPKEGR